MHALVWWVSGPRETQGKWLTEGPINLSKRMLAARLSQHGSACYRVLVPLHAPHPSLIPETSFRALSFTSLRSVSLSYITQIFWSHALLVLCSLLVSCFLVPFLVCLPCLLFSLFSSSLGHVYPPHPLLSWLGSVWTLPDASGWSLPHIYKRTLFLNHTQERSCPCFYSVGSLGKGAGG